MASVYRPYPPSTGPGNTTFIMPNFSQFQAQNIGILPGIGFNSGLGPNNTPNPGPPAPMTDEGILLENSLNEFIALEAADGGPVFHLIRE